MTVRVIDRDFGLRALERRLRNARFARVTVGIHEDAGESGGVTIAEIGAFQEFGTRTIPQRSFIRQTIDMKAADIRALQRRLAKRVVRKADRMQPRQALGILGEAITSMMRARIRAGITPTLAASTLASKKSGRETPLIDTGQLIQSLSFKVVTR